VLAGNHVKDIGFGIAMLKEHEIVLGLIESINAKVIAEIGVYLIGRF
jgi:hypothetical protein